MLVRETPSTGLRCRIACVTRRNGFNNGTVITETFKNEQKILEILKAALSEFWDKTTTDGELLVSAQPMCIKTKADMSPSVRQYTIPLEAGKSIQNQTDQYLDKGILKHVCLHILPVKPG